MKLESRYVSKSEEQKKDLTFDDYYKQEWQELTDEELKTFLACHMLMGLIEKPTYHDYWLKTPLLKTPVFSAIISRNRFLAIMQYLHVSKESPSIKSHLVEKSNKLAKINEMSEFMISLWKKSFNLGQNIVIDESLRSFDGRVAFK